MASHYLGLSLFIILLSFFIILNALSNFEAVKAHTALRSVGGAFSQKQKQGGVGTFSLPVPQNALEDALGKGDSLEQMGGLFTTRIVGGGLQKSRMGDLLHLRLSLEVFSKEISDGLNTAGERSKFLPLFVSLVEAQRDAPYQMDIIAETSESPVAAQDLEDKISNLAAQLEAAGIPSKLMSVGLTHGQAGMLNLRFHPLEKDEGTP